MEFSRWKNFIVVFLLLIALSIGVYFVPNDNNKFFTTQVAAVADGLDVSKNYIPVILKGSKYADRLPIGKYDVIQSFKHDTIRKFYHDWYRPNLMAVAIVGDVDIIEAEKQIKEHFSGLTNPDNMRPRPSFNIPDNNEPLISICSDKEATGTGIEMLYKHRKIISKVIEDYRNIIGETLLEKL